MRRKSYLYISVFCFTCCAVILLLMVNGCSTTQSDTRLFAVGKTASAGFDSGIDLEAEQRVKYGPVMALVGGKYSPTKKSGAEDGYQYGADVGIRYYLGPWFAGAGYYWSGYHMEFPNGSVWDKDGHNVTFSAGWEHGPWEFRFEGSPEENQTSNHVSFFRGTAEWKFYGPWVLSAGLYSLGYDQAGNRKRSATEFIGIGVEF